MSKIKAFSRVLNRKGKHVFLWIFFCGLPYHNWVGIHQLRSNSERGRMAWMHGNYYCVHAIFVEKIDGIQKKSVFLGMGMIRLIDTSDKVEGSEDMGHLHLPLRRNPDTVPRGREHMGIPPHALCLCTISIYRTTIYRKSLCLFSQSLSKCFVLRFRICDLWLRIFLCAEVRKSINLPRPRTCVPGR
jgi:hypothetical protein